MLTPLRTNSLLVLTVCLAVPVLADVGLGVDITADLDLAEPVSIIVTPEGGEPLTMGLPFGSHPNNRVDATFTITLRNEGGQPIVGYPAEDIWLQTTFYGYLAVCQGGAHPDGPTDAAGRTTFSGPFRMGGHCDAGAANPLTVWVMTYAAYQPQLDLRLVSPDLNGDLVVNLTDVLLFATDYFSGTHPSRSDFVWDGVVNLSDLIVMTRSINTECTPWTP